MTLWLAAWLCVCIKFHNYRHRNKDFANIKLTCFSSYWVQRSASAQFTKSNYSLGLKTATEIATWATATKATAVVLAATAAFIQRTWITIFCSNFKNIITIIDAIVTWPGNSMRKLVRFNFFLSVVSVPLPFTCILKLSPSNLCFQWWSARVRVAWTCSWKRIKIRWN